MRFRADERGQAIQIGAVLLFGALIIAFAGYQAFVVPDQNREVEFGHNQEIQGQLQDLRNAIVTQSGGGSERRVPLMLGTEYPDRIVALNPGPATGSLRTVWTDQAGVTASIDGAVAAGEPGDFWNGSARRYRTGAIRYEPNYNVYDEAPVTTYENTVLANLFRSTERAVTGQTVISGRRISLVTLNGSLSTTRAGRVTVRPRPVSASDNAVTITSDDGGVVAEYFEAEYDGVSTMPAFDSANRVRTTGTRTFDVGDRDRDDDFAFRFTGQIDVPESGSYTFYTTSDDGSRLDIDGSTVVNNDGQHSANTESGSVTLSEGEHDIEVTFFENNGLESLSVEWESSAAGIARQPIPADRLSNDQGLDATPITLTVPTQLTNETWAAVLADQFTKNGGHVESMDVRTSAPYEYYEAEYGGVSTMPTFDTSNLVRTGETANFDISKRDRDDDFAFRFNKRIDVPATATYTFYTTSDDGSRLYIDGERVVNNDGLHAPSTEWGTVSLSAGTHDITVTHFENDGQEELTVEWESSGAGVPRQVIPDDVLSDRVDSELEVALEPGVDYQLRMARVGVGTGVAVPQAAYLTPVETGTGSVDAGGTRDLVVEVRDAYNNPVGNVSVNASTKLAGSTVSLGADRTGPDGRVTLTYDAPAIVTDPVVTDAVKVSTTVDPAAASEFEAGTPTNVSIPIRVSRVGGASDDNLYTVDWANPSTNPDNTGLTCSGNDCAWATTGGDQLELTAVTGVPGVTVDFAVNDSNVGTVAPGENATVQNGGAETDLTAGGYGTVAVYAVVSGSGDRLNVTITEPLSAAFDYSPSVPAPGETVTFSADPSSGGAGGIVSYEWDFNNDGSFEANGQTATTSFPSWGFYPVYLRVTDASGVQDTETDFILVWPF